MQIPRSRAVGRNGDQIELVWFQAFGFIEEAIQREKSLKRWLQKYEPKGPLAGVRVEMGPRVGAVGLSPAGLPDDYTLLCSE